MTTKGKIGIIIALVICIGLFSWMKGLTSGGFMKAPQPPKPLTMPDNISLLTSNWSSLIANAAGPPLGNPNAPWTVIEFGDFQCPQCGKAYAFAERMVQKSNGQVKLYFVNFPLTREHIFARSAALAGLAAANQGKFWQMYTSMYANQNDLRPSAIDTLAKRIQGLDLNKFHTDWAAPATAAMLNNEVALVTKVEVQITPTFVLRNSNGGNVKRYIGNFGQHVNPVYPGLVDLMLTNPWHVRYPPEDIPGASGEQ